MGKPTANQAIWDDDSPGELRAMDALGNADPWRDLWFYANPIVVWPT
ncbi:hypothetical protein [Rhizocola hellebori]|nr:hypothetical protein [Rhizocola hellebori]